MFDALVWVVPFVLELIADPQIGVLARLDAEFFGQSSLGRLLLALTLDGVGGDGPVPVGVPEAFVGASLGE